MKIAKTHVFIDAQNLTKGTAGGEKPWKIDLQRFRVFLTEKYHAEKVYYFIGVYEPKLEKLYDFLKKNDYEVIFREHAKSVLGKKKGNVDTDIVFTIMDEVYRQKLQVKIVLVSGDGDYKKMVSRLITDNKLRAIMFPNKKWSSLYRTLNHDFAIKLYLPNVRWKIEYKK